MVQGREDTEGREALPHTPFKELFEKSSLKIFKNFEQVKWLHSRKEGENSGCRAREEAVSVWLADSSVSLKAIPRNSDGAIA